MNSIALPIPDQQSLEQSQHLVEHIKKTIVAQGGKVTFAHYMQLALYTPGLGYYSSNQIKFGEQGDFITAPEISPLFGQCLANYLLSTLPQNNLSILELGAGTGKLAVDILTHLAKNDALPEHYYILELSAYLKNKQYELLQKHCPDYLSRVIWLDTLPKANSFKGVIVANEVMDAMPVNLFHIKNNAIYEHFVTVENEQLTWTSEQPSNAKVTNEVKKIQAKYLADTSDYTSEINLQLEGWIKALAESLAKGEIILIDYGFPENEYYHPQRKEGTLICHYKHHSHSDPFLYPGLQDITTHVNFTQVASSAKEAGLNVKTYTTQTEFLLNTGLMELAQPKSDPAEQIKLSQQIKKLLMPHEMGELFKVIVLEK